MIILDTNVLSAMMRETPDARVVSWLDRQPRLSIWTTSVTVFEIRFCIAVMPAGRRRARLQQDFERCLDELLERRVVAFDLPAARETTLLAARRRQQGRPADLRDSMIAGAAVAHRAILATRNTRHFDDLPIRLVDPWQE